MNLIEVLKAFMNASEEVKVAVERLLRESESQPESPVKLSDIQKETQ